MRRRFKILGGAALLVALVAGAFGAAQAFANGSPTHVAAAPAGANWMGAYGNGWMASGGMGYSMMQAASQVLGVPVQDVYQGLLDGKTLAQQAQAKGVAPSAMVDAFKAAEQARLAQMVQAGMLTQQQADSSLQWYVDMANWMMSNTFGGYGAYGPGMTGGWANGQSSAPYGPGMMGGQFGGGPAAPQANQAGPSVGAGGMNGWQWSSPPAPAPGQAGNQYGPGMMANGLRQSGPQVSPQSAPAVSQPVAPAVNQPAAPAANQNGGVSTVARQSTRSSAGTGMMGGATRQGGGMGMMGR